MKTAINKSLLAALAAVLILSTTARAQVIGINAPLSSSASIQFDDTSSFDPLLTPGATNITLTVSPWNGLVHTLPSTTDPITLDNAQGDITAAVIFGNYDIAFNNVSLTQAPLNTGFAHLIFNFSVEFQIGALGLPIQPTLYPNFLVNGTVQPAGFAFVGGFINYDAVNTAGTITTVETVNYNQLYNVPGPFAGVVTGVPVNGTTPALVANTTLTLSGTINFMVDPANIDAQSQMVPEPSAGLLVLLAAGLLQIRRRRP